jgi:GNAT superfamily N-acetyltransferase
LNTHVTGSTIRLAQPSDEPEIISCLKLMHAECGWQPLDVDYARATFARAFDRKGGILAVIGVPGHIRAMLYLMITNEWYTRENHLQELFCWVHPDHRNSDYGKLLIEYAKKCSDDISAKAGVKVPLIMGVLTNKRMSGKVRLYRRVFGGLPVGATFMHNANWINQGDLSDEDIWRVPSMRRVLLKQAARPARKTNGAAAQRANGHGQ